MSDELERHAAACLLASFRGHYVPDWVRRRLERGLGGIVLFADNVRDREQLAALTGELRSEREELVVAIDEEGGDVTRLEAGAGSSYPGNLALGSIDDVELTRAVAGAIAGELAAVGVTLNLAPVADVNSNPQNPVIGVRSFGSDPELVARHVVGFVAGTHERGVAACAKHFPGHGDTATDSHLALPVIEAGREELLAGPLVPFRAAVEAGVAAVMTAHLLVRALDPVPATLSETLVTGILRRELGFEGVVVSDALEMRAISATVGIEEGAVAALAAGVDALCIGHDVDDELVERVQGAIVGAVQEGRLPVERLAAAAEAVPRLAGSPAADRAPDPAVGALAARRALRVRGDVALEAAPLVVELEPEPLVAAGPAAHGLGSAIRERRSDTEVVAVHDRPDDAAGLARSANGRALVVVLRDAARHPWQQAVASELLGLRPDAVVVETGLPGWLPERATASVETYGAGRVNLEAAAELLVPAKGYSSDA
jgi:beta-N-acetylhexosaminidase